MRYRIILEIGGKERAFDIPHFIDGRVIFLREVDSQHIAVDIEMAQGTFCKLRYHLFPLNWL